MVLRHGLLPQDQRILLSYFSIVYLETTLQDGSVVKIDLNANEEVT